MIHFHLTAVSTMMKTNLNTKSKLLANIQKRKAMIPIKNLTSQAKNLKEEMPTTRKRKKKRKRKTKK